MIIHPAFAIGILLLTLPLLGACGSTSTIQMKDGRTIKMKLSQSDSAFIYGTTQGRGFADNHITLNRSDISDIRFAGTTAIFIGSALSIWGGLTVIGGATWSIIEKNNPPECDFLCFPGLGGTLLAVLVGTPLLVAGLPVLFGGMYSSRKAQRLSGWEEAMQSIRPAPIVLHDGEKNHYGLGLSGRF